jgi:6-pyruvoyltetrahydropterin/6-carboxytetrahydropterin synthase
MSLIGTRVKFEAAHRQLGDEGKCGSLHGHNWMVDFIIEGYTNSIGYIIDFKDLKEVCMFYDHAVILTSNDPLVQVLVDANQKVVTIGKNPTCENLAEQICRDVISRSNGRIKKVTVTVWENDVSYATFIKGNGRRPQ